MVLSPRSAEMATRSATARLEKRRVELDKLQTTSHAFKEARSVVPRGTGTDKLWFKSGQYWGKAYTIGLILKHEGLPIAADDPCFELPSCSNQKRAWEEMQAAALAPAPEEQPRKKPAHHQGDLSATPDKLEAFATHLCKEALSSSWIEVGRYYQNSVSSVYRKLLLRHGYAEPDYNPLGSQQHKQRKAQLKQLHQMRVGWKVAPADEYRISPEEMQRLNTADAGYPSVKEDAQGSRGWKSTHVPTYEVLDSEFLTQKGGLYLRLLQLVDQLIVPGIKEARAQAKLLPSDNRQQRCLRQECLGHLDWLHARKWTFFALAALYYPTQKQHRIFKDHPFFQKEEAVRLFEELWIPLVHNSFDLGAKAALDANKKAKQHPWTVCELGIMFKDSIQGKEEVEVTRSNNVPVGCRTRKPSELQRWLRIASSSDVDAIVAELYA
ncbi:hypothetical protein WJX79_001744 [Trebouxia sp. C0005]